MYNTKTFSLSQKVTSFQKQSGVFGAPYKHNPTLFSDIKTVTLWPFLLLTSDIICVRVQKVAHCTVPYPRPFTQIPKIITIYLQAQELFN